MPTDSGPSLRTLLRRALLRFEPVEEAEFLRDRVSHYLLLSRVNLWLACVLYLLFLWFDAASFRRLADEHFHQVVYLVLMPVCALGALATHVRRLQRFTLGFNAVAAVVTGTTLAIFVASGTPASSDIAYHALIIHYLYVFALFGLLFWQALAIACLSYTICVVGDTLAGTGVILRFDHAFFLGSIIVIGTIVAFLQELTQRRAWTKTQELKYMSAHDPLTGLLNRRAFFERGEQLLRLAQRELRTVTLLFVDLDHFKTFNDLHGHAAGDECLKQCSAAISALATRPLDLVARLGGDEFVAMLYDAPPEMARRRAEELRARVSGLSGLANGQQRAQLTVSVGVLVEKACASTTLSELISHADAALYEAKAHGRNCVSQLLYLGAGTAAAAPSTPPAAPPTVRSVQPGVS